MRLNRPVGTEGGPSRQRSGSELLIGSGQQALQRLLQVAVRFFQFLFGVAPGKPHLHQLPDLAIRVCRDRGGVGGRGPRDLGARTVTHRLLEFTLLRVSGGLLRPRNASFEYDDSQLCFKSLFFFEKSKSHLNGVSFGSHSGETSG